MGMYDSVKVVMDCPNCDNKLDDFQSKDGNCTLSLINPNSVDNFYDYCKSCGTWIEFTRNDEVTAEPLPENPFTLDDVEKMGFKIKVKTNFINIEKD